MRVAQPRGERGSLKWIQRAVNDRPFVFDAALKRAGVDAQATEWLSPLESDDFAEYRDAGFLDRIGQTRLTAELASFWPNRGPQWDALAIADGEVLLVEAKAHISELLSPGTKAGPGSLDRIERALAKTVEAFDAKPLAPWSRAFYQLGNRFAFLNFLNSYVVPARLLLVNFVGDADVKGPVSAREWHAAYEVAFHVMGIAKRNRYAAKIHHVFVDVADL